MWNLKYVDSLLDKTRSQQQAKIRLMFEPHLAQTTITSFNQKKFVKFRDEKSFFSSLSDIVRCEWFS